MTLCVVLACLFAWVPIFSAHTNADKLSAFPSGVIPPRRLSEFSLLDAASGRPFARDSLIASWWLVFSGFSNCPDICPTTLATLASLQRRLEDAGVSVPVLFVSVDDRRDTPAVLVDYTRAFGDNIIAVTGAPLQRNELLRSLGFLIPAQTQWLSDPAHSSAVALVSPTGFLHHLFRYPLDGEAMLQTITMQLQANVQEVSP